MSDLPRPVTAADELLVAIHGVLADIRDRLPAPPSVVHVLPPGQVELREPAAGPPKMAGGRARKRPDTATKRPARTTKSTPRSSRKEDGDG